VERRTKFRLNDATDAEKPIKRTSIAQAGRRQTEEQSKAGQNSTGPGGQKNVVTAAFFGSLALKESRMAKVERVTAAGEDLDTRNRNWKQTSNAH